MKTNFSKANHPEGAGVLDEITKSSSVMDSPVPSGARMPLKDIVTKAAEVASADDDRSFPAGGVMMRD